MFDAFVCCRIWREVGQPATDADFHLAYASQTRYRQGGGPWNRTTLSPLTNSKVHTPVDFQSPLNRAGYSVQTVMFTPLWQQLYKRYLQNDVS